MTHIDSIVETDGALILGAGIAGLFTALKLGPMPSIVLAGTRPGMSGSSAWAQGGIAAAIGEDDSWQSHAHDTMVAGAGLCDPAIVDLVAREAPARIEDLVALGAPFDRNVRRPPGAGPRGRAFPAPHRPCEGRWRGRGDFRDPGGPRCRSRAHHPAGRFPRHRTGDGKWPRHRPLRPLGPGVGRPPDPVPARAVVLATGGLGALYGVTTNPLEARGEGLGMAARAGALIADPEFVQFHPTAIAVGARDPAPLATEALRGEGSVLVNARGERFMTDIHNDAELAPRDIVARAIHRQIVSGQKVYLDCRSAIGAEFPHHFPTVYAACMSAGIDPVPRCDPGGAGGALSYGLASPPTPWAVRRCPDCGWWANAPPRACMAPTGWPPIHCWKAWCVRRARRRRRTRPVAGGRHARHPARAAALRRPARRPPCCAKP